MWFGDVNTLLPELNATADAIYLDGFAPSKNPDMWQSGLFTNLARLSRSGTTVATFTSAGLVKRGLQQAGFSVAKVKGFGRKREMLTARMDIPAEQSTPRVSEVTIIGGGIASLCTALALIQRGIAVQLICEDDSVARQASQNRQGAVYPNLHANLTPESQLHAQAFLFARQFYQRWHNTGLNFAMDWCGVLHLATNEQLQQRQQKLIDKALWPASLVRAVNTDQASDIAGVAVSHDGIYYPLAGWLSPQQFCQQAFHFLQQQSLFRFSLNCHVLAIAHQQGEWQLTTITGDIHAKTLILACGSKLAHFDQSKTLPLNKIRGQVSHVKQPALAPLKTVLCHKGYITPQWQNIHCIGATFDRTSSEPVITKQDDEENLQLAQAQLKHPKWLEGAEITSAAAAFRATLPDHLPVVGAVTGQSGLYLFGALGARGIMLSPLLAELLACQICAEPLPLNLSLINRLSANRF